MKKTDKSSKNPEKNRYENKAAVLRKSSIALKSEVQNQFEESLKKEETEGYLEVQNHSAHMSAFKKWKLHWFVCKSGQLRRYDSNGGDFEKGYILDPPCSVSQFKSDTTEKKR